MEALKFLSEAIGIEMSECKDVQNLYLLSMGLAFGFSEMKQ
jgi:hypothetical protein